MMRALIFILLLNIPLLVAGIGFCQTSIYEREFLINNSPEYKSIHMGGLLDGENTYTESNFLLGGIGFEPMVFIRISNIGAEIIHAPRLVMNDEKRWFDFNTLSAEFLSGAHTNKEKALSIWKLMRDNRFHYRTPTSGCNVADPLKALGIYGYMTCGYASTMMTSIGTGLGCSGRVWHLRYQPQPERGHAIAEIDFGDGDVILDLVDVYRNIRITSNTGQSPIVHADSLNKTAYFEMKIESPFVMLDGMVKIYGFQATLQDTLTLQFSSDQTPWENLWSASTVGLFLDSVSLGDPSLMLTSQAIRYSQQQDSLRFFYPTQPYPTDSVRFFTNSNLLVSRVLGKYAYYLRFIFSPADSVTGCGIDSLKIATIIQTSRRFMPRLKLNDNILEYADANSSGRSVEIEIVWQESIENSPPDQIVTPVFPPDGGEPEHTQFTFSWSVPADPDGDEIVDYEFQLSDRPDMRFPLSTNFEMYISAFGDTVEPQFNIPWPGLLNDGTTYYWKVRAKDSNGTWGRWSPIWSFMPHGVMMPLNGEVVEIGNEFYVQWQPNPVGNVAAYFEIHGSNEPNGFLADSSTRIGISDQSEFNITGKIYDYYRVVAVDSQNQASGPSRLIYFDGIMASNRESPLDGDVGFAIFQNYPNPFNATTTIRYHLPQTLDVTLKIYDILGREVFVLVNERQAAGEKSVVWNGWDQFGKPAGSGIYFCRIQAGKYDQIHKILLVRIG
ncbi:MAG: T9SS type A sorting domain-containing protein [Calditrichaeota bacterium]|nr:T9SS type A sorting domain-containing protein [Calditrichota bacterium]